MACTPEHIVGLVDVIVRPLLEHEEALFLEGLEEEDGTIVVNIQVHEDDAGHVIGRQGRIIKAIRTLARAAASREGAHVEVELVE